MTTRRFLSLSLLAGLALAALSCGGGADPAKPEVPAPQTLTLSSEGIEVPAEGIGTQTLTVKAPFRPAVSGVPEWISWSDGPYEDYQTTFSFSVAPNTGFQKREAAITVRSSSLSATFTVTQAAAPNPYAGTDPEPDPDIAPALTNAKASANARKVYDFLRKWTGHVILSGVQSEGTANNNDNLNAIFTKTGRHPAVAGYDYIFQQYSPTPAGSSWYVNYEDISAQKEQWESNGLVSFMWHWNVPTSKEAWEKGKQGDFDGYNFYSKDTAFDIRQALTEGTWEHEFLLNDIRRVAGFLKLLRQEGIPVLWRPLHEAAGNYNLYGDNGAWFWWGRGGADACKQLWKLLRDQLEGEYGLDNLIWVWTLDAAQGAESQYADWYPGNDLVDIIGVDIYADDTEAKARQYEAAVALGGGKKLVTLSECGNIPDPRKCLDGSQAWSWFLVWNLNDYKLNTNSYWKELMNDSRVMTRETIPSFK